MKHHHDGEVQGDPEEDEETPLLLLESLPEVPNDRASLKVTEQASSGSFFIGVNGGVICATISSSLELDPLISNRDGEESGVWNGVPSLLPLLASLS